ncbi:hypothetical protein PIB30_046993 [Stylosanthes scabra]|uniref:Uncharacterized protein n=1 Tax=Stylosanthes scabra TaxID=79078 RepID=A0ABU6WEX0_9FABA|nr:hypothetical protein [Stylosanthes scabra]
MREFNDMEEVDVGRYITKEVMEAVRIPRIFLPIIDHNEGNDIPMRQYIPGNEAENADFGNQEQDQGHHKHIAHHFEPPHYEPQQPHHFPQQQPQYQELYIHYNNLYNYMKEKQKFIAKELDEIKRFQVAQTMMASSCTDPIEKVNMTLEEHRNEMIMIKRQLKEWTKNASYKDTYCYWAFQQSNPNLIATYKIPEIMQENAEKGRNIFYGFLKSDPEVGSSFAPTPGPNQAPNQHDHH